MNAETQPQPAPATDIPPGSSKREFAWADTLIIIMVAWLGEYAGAIATTSPAFVNAWVTGLGADNSTAGMLATSGLIGQTLGLLVGVLLMSRWPLTKFTWIGLVVAIAFDAISIGIDDIGSMVPVRLAHGVGVGLIFAAALNWMGRHQQSIRAFAVFIMLQAILPRAFLNLVPLLTPVAGNAAVYVGMIVWAATCTVFIRALSLNGGGAPLGRSTNYVLAPFGRRAASVFAMVLFNFAAVGMWTFLMRFAESKGLSAPTFLHIIGWSAIFSILGSWSAFFLNTRIDRAVAIVSCYAVMMLNTVAMVTVPMTPATFAIEMFIGSFAAMFLLPYLLASQSALDSSGRLPVWGLICGGVGASLGPLAFGIISQQFSYGTAFMAVALLSVVGCIAMLYATGHSKPAPEAAALA